MASHAGVLRPSVAISAAKAVADRANAHARSARRAISRFARPGVFSIPVSRSAATARVGRNLAGFRLHYAVLLWISLLASLFPSHRAAMLFLMAASKVALSYAVLLRVFPNSSLLRRFLDRRLVAGLFLAVVLVQVALAGAIGNLFLALAVAFPLVLAHAVFRISDDPALAGAAEDGKAAGVMAARSDKKDADLESGGVQVPNRSS
ncbi:hypothetical protein AXF42_Ash000988 [Apostasia shenzhenica]|uniref:PRA1 family protein n=1 Tax=Apostasia shenzhenica TaxID=1088818 RepID=A0A2I0ATL8_9ASPA|nr:hypothetical protein AXF42_Ash000988 [Apostasia shenzhenica]